jgi:hypothetical protein
LIGTLAAASLCVPNATRLAGVAVGHYGSPRMFFTIRVAKGRLD